MYSLKKISHLEFELSNHCNSFCPQCARYNADGSIKDFPLRHLDFDLIYQNDLVNLPNLRSVHLCGGFGDPLMHPHIDKFIDYFQDKKIKLYLSTNASLRNQDWWRALAKKNVKTTFCIDGLSDTHSLYRINTSFEKIIQNAKDFINAGGHARCQTILFKHNEHQIDDIVEMTKQIGFIDHKILKSDRFDGNQSMPVYIKGKYSHSLEFSEIDYDKIAGRKEFATNEKLKQNYFQSKENFTCPWYSESKIYIDCRGLVFPCCFLGTIDKGSIQDVLFESLLAKRDQINLNLHSFRDIIDSKVYDDYLEEKIKKNAHPTCIQNCVAGGRNG